MTNSPAMRNKNNSSVVFLYEKTPPEWHPIDDHIVSRFFSESQLCQLVGTSDFNLSERDIKAIFVHGNTSEMIGRAMILAAKCQSIPIFIFQSTRDHFNINLCHKINIIPSGFTNYLTVLNIIDFVLRGNKFVPYTLDIGTKLSWLKIVEKLKSISLIHNEFSRVVRNISSTVNTCNDKVAVGTLSLPRSGSKALSDILAMWLSPKAEIFHCHNIGEKHFGRLNAQLNAAKIDGDFKAIARTEYKLSRYSASRSIILDTEKTFVFLVERNPVDRLKSEFLMKNRFLIEKYDWKDNLEQLNKSFSGFVQNRMKSLNDWYEGQFHRQLGFDISSINKSTWVNEGYGVFEGRRITLVVLRVEKCKSLFEVNLPSRVVDRFSLISRNSGAERYGKDASEIFLNALKIPADLEAGLFNLPVVKALHS